MRRDELYGSSSEADGHSQADADEAADARARLTARLESLLALDLSPAVPNPEQPQEPAQDAGAGADQEEKLEDEFEFRLFSTSSKPAAPVKVVLAASDDGSAEAGDGVFTIPERPPSYYLAGEPTPEQLQMYRQSALAGDDIVLGARKRAWGLERPWRIIRIGDSPRSVKEPVPIPGARVKVTAATAASSVVGEDGKEKRKRPGKKRRIAARTKAKAEKEKREAADKQKMTKEEHLKEKKKRLNREKKLKRRAKEREQRLAGKGQEGLHAAISEPESAGSGNDSAT